MFLDIKIKGYLCFCHDLYVSHTEFFLLHRLLPLLWLKRNINNFRYAGGVTLLAENGEELKSLLMRVKGGSEKADLKLSIKIK